MAEETAQERLKGKKGEVKGPWETIGKPLKHALIGNPDAKFPVMVDESGYPLMNYDPHEFAQKYPGMDHPMAEAATMGGMLATGAPEMMARSLLAPVVRGVGNAAKTAPMTTALAGGSALAAGTASPTGKTPWETMLGDWERRQGDLKTKMGAEDATIKGIEDQIMAKAGKLATPGTPLYERQQAQIRAMREQSKSVTDPANARKTALQQQLDAINKERVDSQTPIRQAHPGLGVALPPIAWALAGATGNKIGKFTRGLQETGATKMNDAVTRAEQHIANTTTPKGRPGAGQWTSPEGQASAKELAQFEGKTINPYVAPIAGAGAAGVVGAAEGALAPGGLVAIDAVRAPQGSPLQEAASNAPFTGSFWHQAAPEMGVAGGTAALTALLSSLSKGKGGGYGPPVAPTERVNALSAGARAANVPKAVSAAPKAKGKGQNLNMPTNPTLTNLPDL